MLLKLLNFLPGLVGYHWVICQAKSADMECAEEDVLADEDWDDLETHSSSYCLQKKE